MKFIAEGQGWGVIHNGRLVGIVRKYYIRLDNTGERWAASDFRGNWKDGYYTRKSAAAHLIATAN